MFLFGFLSLVAADQTIRRLGGSHEARRLDAEDLGLGDAFSCEVVAKPPAGQEDRWWANWAWMGMFGFEAPTTQKGLRYVLQLSEAEELNTWTGVSTTPCGGCTATIYGDDAKILIIDPPDWTDYTAEPMHWMNFGSGTTIVWDNELDFMTSYFCYEKLAIYFEPETDLLGTLVGFAGFLAQGSWETGAWESCDEINHTGSDTAACTQKPDGSLYEEVGADSPYACALDADMTQTGTTCEGVDETDSTAWAACLEKRLNCEGGGELENCCWWGRGMVQTTGVGNYGELQEMVVKHSTSANLQGVDLCTNPGDICNKDELKFVSGIYFWVTQVETDACFTGTRDAYMTAFDVEATVSVDDETCHSFARGIGGKINMGNWNTDSHGEDCWMIPRDDCDHYSSTELSAKGYADADACKDALSCTTTNDCDTACDDPDGRVERFVKLMAKFKTAYDEYTTPDAAAPVCTGNTAVDTIFHKMDLDTTAGFNDAKSTYLFSGFCDGLKEFIH